VDFSYLVSVVSNLEHYSFIREVHENEFEFLKRWKTKRALLGGVSFQGKDINLIIGFDECFPFSKPQFFLVPFDSIGFTPHVDQDGYICYIGDDVILDYSKPKEIIEDCFNLAINTLRMGFLQENKDDLILEFENYWLGNAFLEKSRIDVFFSLEHKTQIIRRTSISDAGMKKIIVAATDLDIKQAAHKLLPKKKLDRQFKNCLFIALPESSEILPPKMNTFWTIQEFKKIISTAITPEEYDRLKEIIDFEIGKEEIIIIAIKRRGGTTLFGVRCKNITDKKHPLLSENPSCVLSPLLVNRLEKEVIFKRGGANPELNNKKILLVGCGSIGSKLAFEIIKTGISNLTLVDNDILNFENIYRHQLGNTKVGSPKALGLQKAIVDDYPHAGVRGHYSKIESLILNNKITLVDFDLIICATGSPNTNLFS
jgi:hypothetical protein